MGVRFDDRLKTAIMQPVVDQHDRIVRWRQVVDILSRLPEEFDEAIADAGFALVEREAPAIPEEVRAATARNIAGRPANFRMVALFARDRLTVAAPILAAANLSASEWTMIGRDCSAEVADSIQVFARGIDPVRPVIPPVEEAVDQPALPGVGEDGEPPSISQMVARIEQLRTRRAAHEGPSPTTAPVGKPVDIRAEAAPEWPVNHSRPHGRPAVGKPYGDALFRWECDSAGQVNWVDGVPRGALIGTSLMTIADDRAVSRVLDTREPFDGIEAHFDVPAISGDWRLSGLPAFSPQDGRFLGYRGVAHRSDEPVTSGGGTARSPEPPASGKALDLDALRETIHEIKTPLNAIIGFAEIIDGQYLGPAHRNYRQRAAGIVAQARTLLKAIGDMEVAARGKAGSDGAGNVRMDTIMADISGDLKRRAERLGVMLALQPVDPALECGIARELASRLILRFIGAIVDAAAAGERIKVDALAADGQCHLLVTRPQSTARLSEKMLMDPSFSPGDDNQSVLGLGFALRLVRGLMRLVGGELSFDDENFTLRLPGA